MTAPEVLPSLRAPGRFATAAQMRAMEEECFGSGMPVAALMEKAGLRLAESLSRRWPASAFPSVGILSGPGHNGADAAIVARELLLEGRNVTVWSPFPEHKPLTQQHLAWFQKLGGRLATSLAELDGSALLVDGLLGFGNERPPTGLFEEGIGYLNSSPCPVVAVDVPSGIHTDTGRPLGEQAVEATLTLTLGAAKAGLLQDHALRYVGELETVHLGFPEEILARHCSGQNLITPSLFVDFLIRQEPDAHKYTSGRPLLVVGSRKYPGAAILAALGARAAGAGYSVLDAPPEVAAAAISVLPDLVFSENESRSNHSHLERRFDAALCGPGLDGQPAKLESLLDRELPLVLDADAFSLMPKSLSFHNSVKERVLTPHEGEFARLFPDIDADKPKWIRAREASRQMGAIIVLKGPRTVVAEPTGGVFVNVESTSALARAGTGDVLAGFLTGLMARKMAALPAALASVWIHSQAAIRLEKRRGPGVVPPSRLASECGRVLRIFL